MRILRRMPFLLARCQVDVESVQGAGHDEPHLRIRQILPNAIPRSVAKRLHRGPVVICEFGIIEGMGIRQPALGPVRVWVAEVIRVAI